MNDRLGVGFVGAGFVARFHIRSWVGVRDADVLALARGYILGRREPNGERQNEHETHRDNQSLLHTYSPIVAEKETEYAKPNLIVPCKRNGRY